MPWMMKLEYCGEEGKHVEQTRRLVPEGSVDYSRFRTEIDRAADELYMKADRAKADATLTVAWVRGSGS